MRTDYHPAIADELEEIRDHYEVRSPGLGCEGGGPCGKRSL
jgi:hypothetical protein